MQNTQYVTYEQPISTGRIYVTLNKTSFKELSISTSDMCSKNLSADKTAYNEIVCSILDKNLLKKDLWELAKGMLQVSQDAWQEKIIKTAYKNVTRESWKPYIDDGYSNEDYEN